MNSKQLFTKKLLAKERAKIKLFMVLLMQGYFLWCLTCFGGTFLQFSQKFFIWYKVMHA